MQLLLVQNQLQNETDMHFIDSTPVSTCLNRRIFSHKVTKEFASRGKSTKGWFYGFKLHGVCSEKGLLESVVFTSGNINDSKMVEQVTKNMKGRFFCDAGYLKKAKELIEVLKEDPLKNPRPYEELVGNLAGLYSRRINLKHRIVYEIIEKTITEKNIEYEGIVKVIRMWTHYDKVK